MKDGEALFPAHWRELSLNQDKIPLDINYDLYVNADSQGIGHIVTVRDAAKLCGYIILAIMPHLHYKSSGPMAMLDVYYLLPEYRTGGVGTKLIMYAETTLRARGVKKIYFSTKAHQDNSELLEALGFRLSDKVFTKLLE